MFIIKTLLKIFIVLPAIAYGSFKGTWYLTAAANGGHATLWLSFAVAAFASVAYLIWDGKQEKENFSKHANSLGITPEYSGSYGNNGIIIDNTRKKVFAGKINAGKVFDYEEISSIEWQDTSVGNHMKYLIHINTKDFELPQLSVGFANNKAIRDQAYAKLRAALKIN